MAYPHESKFKLAKNWGETKACDNSIYPGNITSDRPRDLCEAVTMRKTLDVGGITTLESCLLVQGLALFCGGFAMGGGGDPGAGVGDFVLDGSITILAGDPDHKYGHDGCNGNFECTSYTDATLGQSKKEDQTLSDAIGANDGSSSRASTFSSTSTKRSPITRNRVQLNCQAILNGGVEFTSQTEFLGQSSFFGKTRFNNLAWFSSSVNISGALRYNGGCVFPVEITYVSSVKFPTFNSEGQQISSGKSTTNTITVLAYGSSDEANPDNFCSSAYQEEWAEPLNTYDSPIIRDAGTITGSGSTSDGESGTDPDNPVVQPSFPET